MLLVWDLKRPERFLYIFLKPNPTSWLFWGSVALAAFAAVAALWLLLGVLDETGSYDAAGAFDVLRWVGRAGGRDGRRATPASSSGRPRAGTCGSRRCCSGTCRSRR